MDAEAAPRAGEGVAGDGLLARVVEAKRRRDWATAETLLRQALEGRPDDPFLRASYADLLCRRGDPDEALALADAVLSEHPGFAPALVARGMAAERLHHPRDAVLAFEAAWAAAPSAFVARRLARARATAQGAGEALGFVRQALERFPGDQALRKEEALLLEGMGRSVEAAEVYRGTLGSAPDDGFAFARMLRASLHHRPPDEALAELARVMRLSARAASPHLLGLRAELQEAAGRWEDAVASWEAALAADPGSDFARARLAYACRRAGRLDRAFGLLQAVLEADPADPAAVRAFVADARALDRRHEAADFLADLVRRHPGRRPLWGWVRVLRRDETPPEGTPPRPRRKRRDAAKAAGAEPPQPAPRRRRRKAPQDGDAGSSGPPRGDRGGGDVGRPGGRWRGPAGG